MGWRWVFSGLENASVLNAFSLSDALFVLAQKAQVMSEDVRPRFGNISILGIYKYNFSVSAIECYKYSDIKGPTVNNNIVFDIFTAHGIHKVVCYKEHHELYIGVLEHNINISSNNRKFAAEFLMDFYTDTFDIPNDNLVAW